MEKQELQKKIPLVVIVGPTASGKSKLAVELAIGCKRKLCQQIPCKFTAECKLVQPNPL